jgi:Holliday junction resolvasome RuvABC ATP-dependent DNA helicase subunit
MHWLFLFLLFVWAVRSQRAEKEKRSNDIATGASMDTVTSKFKRKDVPFDTGDPTDWDEYKGQERVKEMLRISIGTLNHNWHPKLMFVAPRGCVDAETEYLSPTGWRRISEYDGGKVVQCYEDGTSAFVQPLEYIVEDCDEALHFKAGRGMDQVLSPEHRMICYTAHMSKRLQERVRMPWQELTAAQMAAYWESTPVTRTWGGKFNFPNHTTLREAGLGIPLSDFELRVQVAVIADGHFNCGSRLCCVSVKRPRKIERMTNLLLRAGIAFRLREVAGYHRFFFYSPRRDKEFDAFYWDASLRQLEIIAEELFNWDATVGIKIGTSFQCRSTKKTTADFIQYVYTAVGYTCTLRASTRNDRGREETLYTVHVRTPRDYNPIGNSAQVTRVVPEGRKVYCFRVPSSYLLLRRNGSVFITGNCGKTAIARIFADKYLKRWQSGWEHPISHNRDRPFPGRYIETTPAMFETKQDLDQLMSQVGNFDILFFDEVHMFSRRLADTLLPALEDNMYPFDSGMQKLPNVLGWMGATTDVGLLPEAFRDRFQIVQLEPLELEDLVSIVQLQPLPVEERAAYEIARRSAGYPREVKRVYQRAREVALFNGRESIHAEDAHYAFDLLGLDTHGLYPQERQVLESLFNRPKFYAPRKDGTVPMRYAQSASTLQALTGLDEQLFKEIEVKLMRLGFLTISSAGRELTDQALATYFRPQRDRGLHVG